MVVCVQTFGAIAHWHPHLHVLLTDGARMDALDFLARWVHVPDPCETRVRYYGAYATRRRLLWRRRGVVPDGMRDAAVPGPAPSPAAAPFDDWPALRARKRRWAELLFRLFEIEIHVCPACAGAMRIVAPAENRA